MLVPNTLIQSLPPRINRNQVDQEAGLCNLILSNALLTPLRKWHLTTLLTIEIHCPVSLHYLFSARYPEPVHSPKIHTEILSCAVAAGSLPITGLLATRIPALKGPVLVLKMYLSDIRINSTTRADDWKEQWNKLKGERKKNKDSNHSDQLSVLGLAMAPSQEKAPLAEEKTGTVEPPPAYTSDFNGDIPPVSPALQRPLNLDFRAYIEAKQGTTVLVDECIAHLKLLRSLADLRDHISKSDGLFGIHDNLADTFQGEEESLKALALIREKRWGVYVSRAVHRFEIWVRCCTPTGGPGSNRSCVTLSDVEENPEYRNFPKWPFKTLWNTSLMPPLDVVMVWHAYMLNPRDLLEDCLRLGKMSFWTAGLPLEVINECIDNASFEYTPAAAAAPNFEMKTGLLWDNLHDPPFKTIQCPGCYGDVTAFWTEDSPKIGRIDDPFMYCRGYADKGFKVQCQRCHLFITQEKLRLGKFRNDIRLLAEQGVLLPGTLLTTDGVVDNPLIKANSVLFPNKLIAGPLYSILFNDTDLQKDTSGTMFKARDIIGQAIQEGGRTRPNERIAIRRMMSRYWENSSPFALDLVGAVIRQGVFIDKMDKIDWLHSPALESTMARLIQKYVIFFRIIGQNKGKLVVPTLDVDLAWHTHQLTPQRYYTYSMQVTHTFVNHDDKVVETQLSAGFEWTSKQYQKLTGGGIYSECTCWYCEAVREPHIHAIFSTSAPTARKNAAQLHARDDISPDPERNAHISAHNSVREPETRESRAKANVKILELKYRHNKVLKRAAKRGGNKNNIKEGGVPMYYWGVPLVAGTFFLPFAMDPAINCDMYPSNPACLVTPEAAAGGCVAGTCFGNVFAGVCSAEGGGGGGCGGGGGGCGSGGGGGCGGGGGGGGCGGGGGGGGGC
ncbi:hypothetical protein FQN49_006020 [Arthroderma sp. PD_2]|nr:hypothetical protein FQN49_006020 [Arthroderma sp. PD_2]